MSYAESTNAAVGKSIVIDYDMKRFHHTYRTQNFTKKTIENISVNEVNTTFIHNIYVVSLRWIGTRFIDFVHDRVSILRDNFW